MKVSFKPLSLAIAVSAAAAGYAGTINAQTLAGNTGLGDLAIVPYYTVAGDWTTGISIINTSDLTQVIKMRLRRGTDSMDSLDFNLVLSPEDVWTGYLDDANELGSSVRFYTNDNSCTVPAATANANGPDYFQMPDIFEAGAKTGYIEVIGMGSADATQPISVAALHATATTTVPPRTKGVPANCAGLQTNFARTGGVADYYGTLGEYTDQLPTATPPGTAKRFGVINSGLTSVSAGIGALNPDGISISTYADTGNVLKVSYFIKNSVTGIEFGDDAVHIAGFMAGPSITNQVSGLNEDDLQGFDYPDLNGGAAWSALEGVVGAAGRGQFLDLRTELGVASVINDWSDNEVTGDNGFSVDTDWVITAPGQYNMLVQEQYIESLEDAAVLCNPGPINSPYVRDDDTGLGCDHQDLPLGLAATVYDREELGINPPSDEIVISPTRPGTVTTVTLENEVNVIQWGTTEVLDAKEAGGETVLIPKPEGAKFGWASIVLTSDDKANYVIPDGAGGTGTQEVAKVQAICDYVTLFVGAVAPTIDCVDGLSGSVPIVGFAAWGRNFDSNPAANYGRIIGNSYTVAP
jgi:hypothetical protein